jgi:hypothetical protein
MNNYSQLCVCKGEMLVCGSHSSVCKREMLVCGSHSSVFVREKCWYVVVIALCLVQKSNRKILDRDSKDENIDE